MFATRPILPLLAVCMCAILASSTLTAHAASTPFPYSWDTLYYTARVDNFNFASSGQTYQMKYLVNKQWAQPGGPIFFYAGNEGAIEDFANNTGFMWDIAPQFNAIIVFAEHRYYGTSWPLGDDSITPAGLIHLSAEQAMADYAGLITYLKQSWNMTDTPVIAFGGSYGGMLAAWFRKKYPHIIAGAIASAAPIWYADSVYQQFDAGTYARGASNNYAAVSTNCFNNIGASWTAMQSYATKYGMSQLSDSLGLCTPLTDPVNITKIVWPWVQESLAIIGMGDYPYPTTFLGPLPGNPVTVACSYFAADNMTIEDQLVATRQLVNLFYNFTGLAGPCHNLTSPEEGGLAVVEGFATQWDYQTCTELIIPLGFYGPPNDLFYPAPWNLTQKAIDCQRQFNVTIEPHWVESQFGLGATAWLGASNIVFANGNLDPWSAGGVLTSISDTVVAVPVIGGAHHLDLRSSNPADPPGVIWARQQEIQWIQTFIDHPNPTAGACTHSGLTRGQVALVSVIVTIACGLAALGTYSYCQRKTPVPTALSVNQASTNYQPL